MNKIIDELRKGNQTLTLKVTSLEQENEKLQNELVRIKAENYTLKENIISLKRRKENSNNYLMDTLGLGGIFKQMVDLGIKEKDINEKQNNDIEEK